jgi:hypothetical protein
MDALGRRRDTASVGNGDKILKLLERITHTGISRRRMALVVQLSARGKLPWAAHYHFTFAHEAQRVKQ